MFKINRNKSLTALAFLGAGSCFAQSPAAVHSTAQIHHKNNTYVSVSGGFSSFELSGELKKSLDHEKVDFNNLKKTLKDGSYTAGLALGRRIGDFDLELGYVFFKKDNKDFEIPGASSGNVKYNRNLYNVYLDAKYNLYMTENLKLKPSVGLGYLHSKIEVDSTNKDLDDFKKEVSKKAKQIQPRVGLGFGYDVSDHVEVGVNLTHQFSNSYYDSVTGATANIAYSF